MFELHKTDLPTVFCVVVDGEIVAVVARERDGRWICGGEHGAFCPCCWSRTGRRPFHGRR